MKILVAEDDFASRKIISTALSRYGEVDVTADGEEALNAVRKAFNNPPFYDLICLDIMMPIMDGQEVLTAIRKLEDEHNILPGKGVKIMMATALSDSATVMSSFAKLCDGYIVKPITKKNLAAKLAELGIFPIDD